MLDSNWHVDYHDMNPAKIDQGIKLSCTRYLHAIVTTLLCFFDYYIIKWFGGWRQYGMDRIGVHFASSGFMDSLFQLNNSCYLDELQLDKWDNVGCSITFFRSAGFDICGSIRFSMSKTIDVGLCFITEVVVCF